ncbi:AbrB family transcriptional regulator [Prosthecomicrobium sp. N25]|uniref:AbrB family transcriptional regulator n=1 Tax=Prosthecomicrobium sp. N25 TaxID=3129254 RepID=UPI003076F2A2
MTWTEWRAAAERSLPILAGFLIAGAGGLVFALLNLPAPWIAGSTLAVSVAALLRVPLAMPNRLRDLLFILLGISMGSGVSPESVHRFPQWPLSLAIVALSVGLITGVAYLYFRRVAGWDWRTAFLASVPGALSYVLAVAIGTEADIRRVVISQSLRVLLLVVVLPFGIVGLTPPAPGGPPVPLPASWTDLALLLAAGAASGLLAERAGLPAGRLTGAFVASAVLHGAGVVEANLPPWLLIPSFLGISLIVGVRFAGTDLALLRSTLGTSLAGFLIGGACAVLCAWGTVLLVSVGWGPSLLAFAPGGLEAMTALSFTLGLDPAFVATHQLFRFMGIALFVPAVFVALDRRAGPPPPP